MLGRRELLSAAGAGVSLAVTRAALGQEIRHTPSREGPFPRGLPSPEWVRFPEPNVRALDPRFNKYMVGNTYIERLWTGAMWMEGPVWFGDVGMLIFSDIPNNRLMKYDEHSGEVSVLREPSGYSNGNTRDRQGCLISCLQDGRAIVRTEHDGKVTVVAAEFDGKKLNGPNDVVVKSDGTIWFSDPGYGLGSYYESDHQTGEELPRSVYRFDPKAGKLDLVSKDQTRPNGLAFSPDEKKLYICDTGITDGPDKPSDISVYDVGDDGKLSNRQTLFDLKKQVPQLEQMALNRPRNQAASASGAQPAGARGEGSGGTSPAGQAQGPEAGFFKYGIADGIRVDADGNLWAGTGWGGPVIDGVTVIAPDGAPIGRIFMPEVVANVAFGGAKRNRLFMAGSTSLYAVYVNVAGAGIA
ncbi:MAG TPA: SMP-30/gluconolactonase/LRE family protein [Stellaceae bacterium]|nr:SMP-30/gluconolactonase/LRE family protein [Stellaceae bacterium]